MNAAGGAKAAYAALPQDRHFSCTETNWPKGMKGGRMGRSSFHSRKLLLETVRSAEDAAIQVRSGSFTARMGRRPACAWKKQRPTSESMRCGI